MSGKTDTGSSTKGNVEWFASRDGEIFTAGPYKSKEVAINDAPCDLALPAGECFWVAEKGKFVPEIDGQMICEHLEEQAWDECGEVAEGWLELSQKDYDELSEILTAALRDWMKKHKTEPRFWPAKNVTEHTSPLVLQKHGQPGRIER